MVDLAGSAGMTEFAGVLGGNPVVILGQLWFGRATGTTPSITVTVNAAGDDCYCQLHEFSGVHTGSSLSDVWENDALTIGQLGLADTSTTVSDVGVETNGSDRLALNAVFISDDATGIASFAGETGGDWVMVASYAAATGTDGTVALMAATIASAGTINGGSDTITSDSWGVIGFALKPVPPPPPLLTTAPMMPAGAY